MSGALDDPGGWAGVLIFFVLPLVRLAARRSLRPQRSPSSLYEKETSMSDLPNAPVATASAEAIPVATAPVAAAADAPSAVDPNKVVASVVQTVQSHPDVPAPKAASVIASILSGLYQAQPAIFAVTRAGSQTQAEVSLGLGLAEVIVGAFLHPAG